MSKKQYISPSVVRSVRVETGAEILAGSVVDSLNQGGVETTGQEVQQMDFSNEASFSHDWE